MAEVILSREQLENAARSAVVACLGLDPASTAAQKAVRVSWPVAGKPGSSPGWTRDEDVCFLRLTESTSDPYGNLQDITHAYDSAEDRQREIVCYTRVHVCYLIFYGPHAFDHADSVRIGLFRSAVRAALRDKNLYPVPGVGAPVRAPELVNSEWWERADLTVTLYEYVRREYDEDYYDAAENLSFFGGTQ